MNLEMLISSVDKDPLALIERMNVRCDAIIINQLIKNTDEEPAYRELKRKEAGDSVIRVLSLREKGVGLSRNSALMRARGDICLFCDDDIIYEDGAPELILNEFKAHPEADMLLFNVEVKESRRTYFTTEYGRVGLHNCGRYPAYSFAIKREIMHSKNLCFSLLFGGGAKYSNGEDSLFISDCIKRGVRVYKTPVLIGREEATESTWFSGYHEKFFFDRGVLYKYLYGRLAYAMAIRFLIAHRGTMCNEIPVKRALQIMREGIRSV